jgi:hypothetical protein
MLGHRRGSVWEVRKRGALVARPSYDMLPRYVASGGKDSLINLVDVSEWLCARAIPLCECVPA